MTPRIGQPLLTPEAVGALPPNPPVPGRHPALPVATVDFRYFSRKVKAPGAGPSEPPVQANPHGIPSGPGHHDDVSRRTPDLRSPSWKQGHAHPKRVLLFTLPRPGFFPPGWQQGAPVTDPPLSDAGRHLHHVRGRGAVRQQVLLHDAA